MLWDLTLMRVPQCDQVLYSNKLTRGLVLCGGLYKSPGGKYHPFCMAA